MLGSFDRNNYVTKRIWAVSHDGEKIPISIVHRKDIPEGPQPFYLDGYGSYEISNDCYFSSNMLSMLDRGVVFGIAHVRGGGEMGRMWYENGKYLKKENTWRDFVACAQHLIAEGIAHEDKYDKRNNLPLFCCSLFCSQSFDLLLSFVSIYLCTSVDPIHISKLSLSLSRCFRLAIEGRSAGGLLIGATLNTAPKRKDGRPFFAGACDETRSRL